MFGAKTGRKPLPSNSKWQLVPDDGARYERDHCPPADLGRNDWLRVDTKTSETMGKVCRSEDAQEDSASAPEPLRKARSKHTKDSTHKGVN